MRILVVGNKGNISRRYMAILKHLGVEAVGVDSGDTWLDFDKAIVATHTDNHFNICYQLAEMGKGFLCEKPISRHPEDMRYLIDACKANNADGRMVCNWAFVTPSPLIPGANKVQYGNYNTGKDGLAWDCIQLIHLADGMPELSTDSPYLDCHINGTRIHEGHIAMSYKRMIEAWIQDPNHLWSLDDAKMATEKTIQYMETHK